MKEYLQDLFLKRVIASILSSLILIFGPKIYNSYVVPRLEGLPELSPTQIIRVLILGLIIQAVFVVISTHLDRRRYRKIAEVQAKSLFVSYRFFTEVMSDRSVRLSYTEFLSQAESIMDDLVGLVGAHINHLEKAASLLVLSNNTFQDGDFVPITRVNHSDNTPMQIRTGIKNDESSLAGYSLTKRMRAYVRNSDKPEKEDCPWQPLHGGTSAYKAHIANPLFDEQEDSMPPIRVLCVDCKQANAFTEIDQDIIEAASGAIRRLWEIVEDKPSWYI